MYCKNCSGVYKINGVEYEFLPGDLFIVRNSEPHGIIKVHKEGQVCNLNFDIRFILTDSVEFNNKLLNMLSREHKNFSSLIDRENKMIDKIRDIFIKLYNEFEMEEEEFEIASKLYLTEFFLYLMRYFYKNIDEDYSEAEHIMSVLKSMDYIDDNLTSDLTLKEIASVVNFSPTYFGILFKKINGITPWEYINAKRIKKAIDMLPYFKGTMLELATECGFNNTANFNKVFKKYTKDVPKNYKNKKSL